MRISDWSSDVCSSDLGAVIGIEADRRGGAADLAVRGAEEEIGGAILRESEAADRGAVGRAQFDPDAIVERHRIGTGARAFLCVIEQAGIRSEEHTSELQSLMRISYAVFCLKKKNRRPKLPQRNSSCQMQS